MCSAGCSAGSSGWLSSDGCALKRRNCSVRSGNAWSPGRLLPQQPQRRKDSQPQRHRDHREAIWTLATEGTESPEGSVDEVTPLRSPCLCGCVPRVASVISVPLWRSTPITLVVISSSLWPSRRCGSADRRDRQLPGRCDDSEDLLCPARVDLSREIVHCSESVFRRARSRRAHMTAVFTLIAMMASSAAAPQAEDAAAKGQKVAALKESLAAN